VRRNTAFQGSSAISVVLTIKAVFVAIIPSKWLVDFILGVEAGKSDIAEHSFIEPSELEPTVSAPAPFTQRRMHGTQEAAQPVRTCLPLCLLWDPIRSAGRCPQPFGSRRVGRVLAVNPGSAGERATAAPADN
jgi:hypothetical protein